MNPECVDCLWLQYMRRGEACPACAAFNAAWKIWNAASAGKFRVTLARR
jgi:hypothetical protein